MQHTLLWQRFTDMFLSDGSLGVILVDSSMLVVGISDRACRVLGMLREQVLGRRMKDILQHLSEEHPFVDSRIVDGRVVSNMAVTWTNNQERFELLVDTNVLKDEAGGVAGACVIFKDVTNLRSLEDRFQRSDRLAMISQIAAGTAHEIRNPLTAVKGFLQVFQKMFQEQGMDRENGYTEVMLSEVNRINELVNEFLLLSSPRKANYERVSMSEAVEELMPELQSEADMRRTKITYERVSQNSNSFILADKNHVKQLLLHMVRNGIEAMGDGGELVITEKRHDAEDKVIVEIRDTGSGIPLYVIDKIFDPFFTTKQDGTGLGLSICQRIVHDIGGHIRVSSKGYGTTFTIILPIA
ncbi:ATP-binding protein [Paenibacillus sp. YYML68]|uniref:ATP-binding protein n=1 Tax=Paenibacillus sp. YYML68 TaxID=2909250 RepID=UPI0024931B32|nr:ATP-binding protein [Paenibacillus sp. YYML68]